MASTRNSNCSFENFCLSFWRIACSDFQSTPIFNLNEKKKLLEKIKPQYIILKPALVGGFAGSDEWISVAEQQNIRWWITSALESNIGLNAIAQYTFTKDNFIPQGLGTGNLFTNNFESSLQLKGEQLFFKG